MEGPGLPVAGKKSPRFPGRLRAASRRPAAVQGKFKCKRAPGRGLGRDLPPEA